MFCSEVKAYKKLYILMKECFVNKYNEDSNEFHLIFNKKF